jgi:hypothetical protein
MKSLVLRSLRQLVCLDWNESERGVLGKRVSDVTLTYCRWPACGGSTFPHHLNKLQVCYGKNL